MLGFKDQGMGRCIWDSAGRRVAVPARDRGRHVKHLLVVSAILLLVAGSAAGDEVQLNLSVDRTSVQLGQQLRLSVEVSGKVAGVGEPEIQGIDEFSVLSTGSSRSFSLTGGGLRSSTTFTYLLAPTKTGSFKIGPAKLELNGKTYLSQTIEVVVGGTVTPAGPSARPAPGRGPVFLVARVDTNHAYVNQQITLSVLLYSRTQFLEAPRYIPPSTSGFWTEELKPQLTYPITLDGAKYDVVEVRTALFPTAAGTYTIGQATVELTIPEESRRDPFASPFFRGFFSSGRKRILTTEPLRIDVLPLPDEGKPKHFGGAVGRFTIKATLDRATVEENEPVTLTTEVSGEGNLRTIQDAVIPSVAGIRQYPTKGEATTTIEDHRVGGRKVFETVLVPTRPGSYTLPGPHLAFFDPLQGTYREVAAPSLGLEVSPAPLTPAVVESPLIRGVRVVGEDITHIRLAARRWTSASAFPAAPGGWALQVVPLVLLGTGLAWRSISNLRASSQAARNRRTTRMAFRQTKGAKRLVKSGRWRDGLTQTAGALDGYLGQKLGLPGAALTNDRIAQELRARTLPPRLIAETLECRDACDRARFAPGSRQDEAARTVERVGRLIRQLGEHRGW